MKVPRVGQTVHVIPFLSLAMAGQSGKVGWPVGMRIPIVFCLILLLSSNSIVCLMLLLSSNCSFKPILLLSSNLVVI